MVMSETDALNMANNRLNEADAEHDRRRANGETFYLYNHHVNRHVPGCRFSRVEICDATKDYDDALHADVFFEHRYIGRELYVVCVFEPAYREPREDPTVKISGFITPPDGVDRMEFGINKRQEFYECMLEKRELNEDILSELGYSRMRRVR
jgi:hypothetical protein